MTKKTDSWVVVLDDDDNPQIIDNKILDEYSVKADVDPKTGSKQVPHEAWQYGIQCLEPKYDPNDLVELLDLNTYHADCVDAVAGDSAGISYTLIPVEGENESEEERERFTQFLNNCYPSINKHIYRMIYDMRAIGYGAMELIREGTSKSDVVRFCHIQSHTLRRHSDGRRVKQISETGKEVWFVLYGENYDPEGNMADVHADTGEWHPYNSLQPEEKANELVWVHEYAPGTNYYGRPPIIGSLASIKGTLSAKKYNMSFFENYGLPAYAITITGDFADYDESPWLDETDEHGNKIRNPNYDVTQTIRYKITQQIKQVIKNPHSAVCITIPSEGEEGNVDVKIQPLSVRTEEGGFRMFLKDERDEVIHAHKVDPSRIGIYDAGKLNGTNAGFTDNSYKYSTVAPIKHDAEDVVNLIAREELGVTSWEYKSSDLDPKDYRNDIALADFLFARAGMTPRDLINNFGDQFGLTAPEDNPYLDEYYLNNQPLSQLWNQVENNPHMEATSILQSLEDKLWSDEDEEEPKEETDKESQDGNGLSTD